MVLAFQWYKGVRSSVLPLIDFVRNQCFTFAFHTTMDRLSTTPTRKLKRYTFLVRMSHQTDRCFGFVVGLLLRTPFVCPIGNAYKIFLSTKFNVGNDNIIRDDNQEDNQDDNQDGFCKLKITTSPRRNSVYYNKYIN